MASSSETIKTISIASLLGLLMFSVVWIFASSAVVSIPPHSLKSDLLEIGRPIQAVAIDIESGERRPPTAAQVSEPGPVAPQVLVAVARPVARAVGQLTQPIAAVQASNGGPVGNTPKASRSKKEGPGAQEQSRKAKGQSRKDLRPPELSKQGKPGKMKA